MQISFILFLAWRDSVRNVQLIAPVQNPDHLAARRKSHISWQEPLQSNGLIYFYIIHIGQDSSNGTNDEQCVEHDIHSVDVPLLSRRTYCLRIITYTIARLNNENGDQEQINHDSHSFNTTNVFVELVFKVIITCWFIHRKPEERIEE
jgi:hypothetical protein